MEKLMNLQKYVRQVNPRNESYTPPVDKIQNFLTEGLKAEDEDQDSSALGSIGLKPKIVH